MHPTSCLHLNHHPNPHRTRHCHSVGTLAAHPLTTALSSPSLPQPSSRTRTALPIPPSPNLPNPQPGQASAKRRKLKLHTALYEDSG